MPRTFTCDFRIRHSEVDAYGHLHHSNYLRLAQEAAIHASADAGYDDAAYARLGATWFIRETGIDYLRPVKAGETLEVKTWVADFARVRVHREYEMRVAGALAAKAYTDWVYLSRATGQPLRIAPEVVEAFLPDGAAASARRDPFPQPPPAPPGAFRSRRRVRFHELDELRHVNNAVYLDYLEQCAWEAAEDRGWPMSRAMELDLGIVARQHRIEYLRPAVYGDELAITTWIADWRRASAVRHYAVHLATGEPIVRARTQMVCIRLSDERLVPMPKGLAEDFEAQTGNEGLIDAARGR